MTEAINPADPPKEDKGELAARDSEMAQMLRHNDIDRVVVVGLATDFWQVPTELPFYDWLTGQYQAYNSVGGGSGFRYSGGRASCPRR